MTVNPLLARAANPHLFRSWSCIMCGQGTDTAIAVVGPPEFHAVILARLGMPDAQAIACVNLAVDKGQHPDDTTPGYVRVCATCCAAAELSQPGLMIEGGEVPVYQVPPAVWRRLAEGEN